MVSAHPLELLREHPPGLTTASQLGGKVNQRVRMTGWVISAKQITTKKGRPMKYLSMEDTSGCFEVVLFPHQYQLYAPSIIDSGPYLIEGWVKGEWETTTLVAQRIRRMEYGNPSKTTRSYFSDPH